jgi:hypothetical protein
VKTAKRREETATGNRRGIGISLLEQAIRIEEDTGA